MIYTSKYTADEIDSNIDFVKNSTDIIKILSLISLASAKGGTLFVEENSALTVAIVDSNENLIAGANVQGEYIGMDFSDAVTFINSITNN